MATAPTLVQTAAAGVAPTGQCGCAGGGGEGGAPPADGAVRGAGAHGAPAPSPPSPRAGARHHLPAGDGVREGKVGVPGWTGGVRRGAQWITQWWAAERGRAGRTEQRSSDGAPRPAGGGAREWEPAKWAGRQPVAGQGCRARRRRQEQAQLARCARERRGTRGAPGKGTREGRTPRSRQQGARESGASGQRAGEGGWPWVHGVTGISREGIGLVGRCCPASHAASDPTISATTLPCGGDGVPTPSSIPGRAIASARAAAPAGRWDNVGGAGREGRRAQKDMGEDRGRRKEAAGEGSKGHGRSGQGGGGVDGGTRHAVGMRGAGSRGAAASVGGSSEKAG